MIILSLVVALPLIYFVIVAVLISRSPEGWEDKDGFHRGRKD